MRKQQLEADLADYFDAQGEVERNQRDAELVATPFDAVAVTPR